MSDERIGDYRIEETLSAGVRGRLVRARHFSTGERVLVRELTDDLVRDDERLAEAKRLASELAALRHPAVLPVVQLLADEGVPPLLVMEDLPGGRRLSEALGGSEGLGLGTSLKVFRQIVQGLEAAAARDVRHRDLRPATIMVSPDLRRVALFDFGIGHLRKRTEVGGSTMELNTELLNYAAPEKLGGRKTDLRSDLYAAGVVLYEMLTGIVPQIGRFNLPSQLSSEVPPEVDPLVLKCLATKPEDRYATPAEILRDLEALESKLNVGLVSELQGLSRSTSQLILGPEVGRRRRRNLLVGLAVVALAGLGVLAVSMRPEGPSAGSAGEGVAARSEPRADSEESGGGSAPPESGEAESVPADSAAAEAGGSVDSREGGPTETATADPAASGAPRPASPPSGSAGGAEPARSADEKSTPERPRPSTSEPSAAPTADEADDDTVRAREDLRVAEQKLEAGLLDAAENDLGRWLEAHPDAPEVPRARLALGEALRQQGRAEAAMATWIEVETRHAGSSEAVEAALRRAELLATRGPDEQRQAVELFETVATERPSAPSQAARALAEAARVRTEIGGRVTDPELGVPVPSELPTLRRLVSEHPGDPRSQAAFARLAEMYSDLDRHALAAETWEELGRRFPETRHEAWWEAARLWERKLDDEARALAAYRRVPSTSPRYDDAVKKIARLERR